MSQQLNQQKLEFSERVILLRRRMGLSQAVKKFTGPVAALKWCEQNRAAFYYLPPQDVSAN